MAGEWLKFECATPDKPEVFAITSKLGWDDPDLTVGKLFRVWRWFDQQTIDGNAAGVTPALLDRVVGVSGFANAMASVGWLMISEFGLALPNFERHTGVSAKARALTAKRVANHRTNNRNTESGNADNVTEALAREEKRREEEKEESAAAQRTPRPRREDISLKVYLETCKAEGKKPVPADHAIRAYCADAGITDEMLQVAWCVFRDDYTSGTNKAKRYKDWPGHFANAVRGCWAKLWFTDAGEVKWTSRGLQEKQVLDTRQQAKGGNQHAA